MLDIGVSRRAFLKVGGLGALGLSLGDLNVLRAQAQRSVPAIGSGAAKAKSVIMLWLWGGPSHLDTFDMKPNAPLEYRGPFEGVATRVPGLRVCELLPRLAQRADRFSLIRSMHHQSNDHGVAGTIALTGSIDGAIGLDGKTPRSAMKPSTGSIVARLSKARAKRDPVSLPPYAILGNPLHQGLKRAVGEGGGTLGSAYDPFRLNYAPGRGIELPNLELPESLTAQRLAARWSLRGALDGRAVSEKASEMDRHYELARSLIASSRSLEALNIEAESSDLRDRYGPHRFGQCCLIARRLVESGLPFVQVNWSTHVEGPEDAGDGGWDMHDRYFQIMQDRHGWIFDQALAALLDDLHDRGLLDSTLVVAVGEFGRTPKINNKSGRDHWNQCYSAMAAGGGVQGGRIVGASDKRAEHPIDRPCTPADLGATILASLGVTTSDLTAIGLTPSGQPIHELF